MHMALHMVNACNTNGMKAIGGLLLLLPSLCLLQRTATLNWPGLIEEEQQEGAEPTNHISNNGSPLQHMNLPGR